MSPRPLLPPGSFLWLVAHDLRLNWRGLASMFAHSRPRMAVAVLLASAAVLHLVAWPIVRSLAPQLERAGTDHWGIAAGLGAVFTWMIAQSVFGTTRTLYDRADLDLLLGSPLPAERIIAAKAFSVMASTLASITILVGPLANMAALLLGPSWLGVYPALLGMALAATSIGLGVTMLLFILLGPRRARVWSHLAGAGLGGLFVLGAQIYAMLPRPLAAAFDRWLEEFGTTWLARPLMGAAVAVDAVSGDVTAMLLIVGAGGLMFAGTVGVLGRRFAQATAAARGAPAASPVKARRDGIRRFPTGVGRSLRLKEWRLLGRDPGMFAQLGLQIIYTIPVAVVLIRSEAVPIGFAIVPTLVVIAAQVAGSIAWLAVSGEDAPELIATAPVTPAAVEQAKLGAIVLPLLILLTPPLVLLAVISIRLAVITLVCAALAATSTSLLNLWHPMPGNRRGMLRRHSQSKLIGLVEHGLAMLWAITAVFAVIAHILILVPLAMIGLILARAAAGSRSPSRAVDGRPIAPRWATRAGG